MKKINYFIYAAALAGAVFTVSCNKDEDDDSAGTSYKKVSAVVL